MDYLICLCNSLRYLGRVQFVATAEPAGDLWHRGALRRPQFWGPVGMVPGFSV